MEGQFLGTKTVLAGQVKNMRCKTSLGINQPLWKDFFFFVHPHLMELKCSWFLFSVHENVSGKTFMVSVIDRRSIDKNEYPSTKKHNKRNRTFFNIK